VADKLFQKILLTRILSEVSKHGLLCDEQFWFQPICGIVSHLASLVQRVDRNTNEKRLTVAVFLDVAKAFDTMWIEGLMYTLTILNFPAYVVKTISLYLHSRTFQMSLHSATLIGHSMWAGVA
jgi:hypothetical protein